LFSLCSAFAAAAAAATLFKIGKNDLLIDDRIKPVTLDACLTDANGLAGIALPVYTKGFSTIFFFTFSISS